MRGKGTTTVIIFNSGLNDTSLNLFSRIFPHEQINILMAHDGNQSHVKLLNRHQGKVNMKSLDSGAFGKDSAESKGKTVDYDLYTYADDLIVNAEKYDMYFNFDARFDEYGFHENMENQRYLESLGLNPIPVIHNYDTNSEEFKYYLNGNPYPVVALGKVAVKTAKTIFNPANVLHNAGIKVFLLGGTGYSKLAYAPISYCDSTSWCQYPRFGQVCFWDEDSHSKEKTRIIQFTEDEIQWEDYYEEKYKFWNRFIPYCNKTFGFTFQNLVGRDFNLVRQVVNLKFFRVLEAEVTRIHKLLGYNTE